MGRSVRGQAVSSEPISLRRAATVISNFAATDTGAPADIARCVRAVSEAINHLVDVHRHLKSAHNISASQIKSRKEAAPDGGSRVEIRAENGWAVGAREEKSRIRKKKHFAGDLEVREQESRSLEKLVAVEMKSVVMEEMSGDKKKNRREREMNKDAEFVNDSRSEVREREKEMKRIQEAGYIKEEEKDAGLKQRPPKMRKKDKEDMQLNQDAEMVMSKEERSEERKKKKKDLVVNQAVEFAQEDGIDLKEKKKRKHLTVEVDAKGPDDNSEQHKKKKRRKSQMED